MGRPAFVARFFGGVLALAVLGAPYPSAAQGGADAHEIAAALLPLPVALRAGAGVVRLNDRGQPVTLRPTSNGLVCIADRLGNDQSDVRCDEQRFIAVVYRGYQLHGAQDHPARAADRRLSMPRSVERLCRGRRLHRSGDAVLASARTRTPYVMASGTYWSHVMIEHP